MVAVFDVKGARLLSAGTVAPDAGWHREAHVHDCWEFIYFFSGCGHVELPAATLRPSQFHLVIYPPGLAHAERADPFDPEATAFLTVETTGAPPTDAHLLLPDHSGELRWLCERIVAEYVERGVTLLAQCYTRAFLCLVERGWASRLPVEHDTCYLAAQYLQAHYAQPITLAQVAEAVGVSTSYLVHRFSARFGCSVMQYLRRWRVETACRLLRTTELSVLAVAARVGYPDPLHFSRVFKEVTGCSPTAYRRQPPRPHP